MHNTIPKIAAVNGIVGFGKSSLAVTVPVISAMGIQCCPVPTALFSNHPGFPQFYKQNLTAELPSYLDYWQKLSLTFDGILSGFLSSIEQIELVKRLITEFSTEHTRVIIDPVMGDNGRLYSVYTKEMCEAMKQLVSCAHILTPNLTEACILAGMDYHSGDWTDTELHQLLDRLTRYPAEQIVVSGITSEDFLVNLIFDRTQGVTIQKQKKAGNERSGTGDVFAAIIASNAVHGIPFEESVTMAGQFVREAILYTEEHHIPSTDGVYFEPLLHRLATW
ncbi:MAG: pyridoxamine kinase [Lachnospiraceae bacterium]|nr:pyridoxamine kinase [Lachnospiraceae bacterium]